MLNIGTIQKTHHLLGSVKVKSRFDDFLTLLNEKVLIKKANDEHILTISKIEKVMPNIYLVNFKEVKSKEEAAKYLGYSININRDKLPQASLDEYFISDLVYFKVFDDKKYIGDVVDFLETGAHHILVISKDDKEYMIPFVEEVFIKQIDFDKKEIFVNLIEGLVD